MVSSMFHLTQNILKPQKTNTTHLVKLSCNFGTISPNQLKALNLFVCVTCLIKVDLALSFEKQVNLSRLLLI